MMSSSQGVAENNYQLTKYVSAIITKQNDKHKKSTNHRIIRQVYDSPTSVSELTV